MCISEGFHVFHCCLGHDPAITATMEDVPSKLQGSPNRMLVLIGRILYIHLP